MFELKPFSVSKPMCATWLKLVGAPIILLSMPPFFFLDELDDFFAAEEDDPLALAAYLCRIETFLNSSAASCSDEKAMPIMHSW